MAINTNVRRVTRRLREEDEHHNVGENQYAFDSLREPRFDTESDVNGDQHQRQTCNKADFLSQAHSALGRKRGPKADSESGYCSDSSDNNSMGVTAKRSEQRRKQRRNAKIQRRSSDSEFDWKSTTSSSDSSADERTCRKKTKPSTKPIHAAAIVKTAPNHITVAVNIGPTNRTAVAIVPTSITEVVIVPSYQTVVIQDPLQLATIAGED